MSVQCWSYIIRSYIIPSIHTKRILYSLLSNYKTKDLNTSESKDKITNKKEGDYEQKIPSFT